MADDNEDLQQVTQSKVPVQQSKLHQRIRAKNQIAQMKSASLVPSEKLAEQKIISIQTVDSPVGNAFRQIRAKLMQATQGRPSVVVVTSVSHSGGASFVAANLSAAIAFDETNTALLLDCDFDNPIESIGNYKRNGQTGLADYLLDEKLAIEEVIYDTGLPRLRVIPAGNCDRLVGEGFRSVRMGFFLDHISKRYPDRFLIIDAPPVGQSADAINLTEEADFTVLVVAHGKATERQIANAASSIGREKILGVVFNNQPEMSL